MIDTHSVPDLFLFFAESLRESGFELDSRHPDLQALLSSIDTTPHRRVRTSIDLDFTLDEFGTALRSIGDGAEFMWPGSTVESAGLRLLLTHVDEERATRWSDDTPARMSLSTAQLAISPAPTSEPH